MAQSTQLAAIVLTEVTGLPDQEVDRKHLLIKNKLIQKPLIEKNNGKWLKDLKDGSLACFDSTLNAVNCAREIQASLKLEPDLQIRINIHLGEITFEEDNVFGEGISIASEIQSKEGGGGVYISDAIYNTIKHNESIDLKRFGEDEIKDQELDESVESEELSMDQAFLQSLSQVVEKNLDNEQFSVEDLSREMGLSRSQVHRKLQTLTGQSISQFIREFRLEKSMELLKKEVATVSEIGYRVGFGSPTYFIRSFHKYYGYPPGEVKNRKYDEISKTATIETEYLGEQRATKEAEPFKVYHIKDTWEKEIKERKLAAIMFTDIVGYTALMGDDEDKAFQLLAQNRELQLPRIGENSGTCLKEIGDGILASFNSVSHAVRCAQDIQKAAQKMKGLQLRIGVHLGEVIFTENDAFGDGVNIASRIQELTPPHGILVSESVYKNIQNKPGIEAQFIGEANLKNVKDPLKLFQIEVEGVETPVFHFPQSTTDKPHAATWKPLVLAAAIIVLLLLGYLYFQNQLFPNEVVDKSIAVLPFKNFSKDQSNQYFADGTWDVILGHLSKIKGLEVKSRTSTEQYRTKVSTAPQIAEELGITYLLEGSAQKVGNKIRITVQLINAKEDTHIWSENYDAEWANVFSLQSDIARKVAAELKTKLTPKELELIQKVLTSNQEAYEFYLKGMESHGNYWVSFKQEDFLSALKNYQKAIALDVDFAAAYASMASVLGLDYIINQHERRNFPDTLLPLVNRALALDPDLPEAYRTRGFYHLMSGFAIQAKEDIEKAIKLNPNDWKSYQLLGALYINGPSVVPEKALYNFFKALSLVPSSFERKAEIGLFRNIKLAYSDASAFDKAEAYNHKAGDPPDFQLKWAQGEFEEGLKIAPNKHWEANFYAALGEFEKAEDLFRELQQQDPSYSEEFFAYTLWKLYKKDEAREMFLAVEEICLEQINQKRWKAYFCYYALAQIYAYTGRRKEALGMIRNAEAAGFPRGFEYLITKSPMCESLWEDPEFIAIMDRVQNNKAGIRARIAKMEEEFGFDDN